jgi:hypothetical protein
MLDMKLREKNIQTQEMKENKAEFHFWGTSQRNFVRVAPTFQTTQRNVTFQKTIIVIFIAI